MFVGAHLVEPTKKCDGMPSAFAQCRCRQQGFESSDAQLGLRGDPTAWLRRPVVEDFPCKSPQSAAGTGGQLCHRHHKNSSYGGIPS